jgi:large subunit ribosomal protein L35
LSRRSCGLGTIAACRAALCREGSQVLSSGILPEGTTQDVLTVPKLKTHRGPAQRFRKTKTGKIVRRHAFARHILTSKSRGRKRKLGQGVAADTAGAPGLRAMLPNRSRRARTECGAGTRSGDHALIRAHNEKPNQATLALALRAKYPHQDPLRIRFTDLRNWVTQLEGFAGDPTASSEGALESIQMAWWEEWGGS